ncbi:MAG: cardiolipin synthase [Tannerella sp.]|jgi:cardiolipin synthase|nr:cardiolipin synthase [Tannerella sp.]
MGIPFVIQTIITTIYAITVVGTILVVISENRNPIRTLAWVLVLVFVPAVGILFFYFFGQDNRKKKSISSHYKQTDKKINIRDSSKDVTSLHQIYDTIKLASLLERNNDSVLLRGSEVEIITDGHRKFDLLLHDIEEAKHHIHIQYFLFANDETGCKIKDALMKKASEGVEVRFLYDNVANIKVPSRFYNEMRLSGVRVVPFMNVSMPWFKSRMNYRNHRKVVVIDGNIGYVGGMNIGNNYFLDLNWRDTHLHITGKGVYGLQHSFLADWYTSNEERLHDDILYYPPCEEKTDNLLQIATCGPNTAWSNLLQAAINIAITARNYLYIQTPYFLPTDSLVEALQIAALSGVDVRLMVSRKSDSSYIDPGARSYYSGLLRAGMRIYEHQTKFIHAKTMVSDDFLSVIGSANMDFRSFESNFEINCYLYDRNLAEQNKQIFLNDMLECKEIILDIWEQRSWWPRLKESVTRLFAPLM